jgi:hypothetical protein
LFIDIIGYSRLLITEQTELLRTLTTLVRETEQFQLAEAEDKLVRIPTGDGMALVFRTSPEAPAKCALELSAKLKAPLETPPALLWSNSTISTRISLQNQSTDYPPPAFP